MRSRRVLVSAPASTNYDSLAQGSKVGTEVFGRPLVTLEVRKHQQRRACAETASGTLETFGQTVPIAGTINAKAKSCGQSGELG